MEQALIFNNSDFEKAVRDTTGIRDRSVFPADAEKVKKLCCAEFSFSEADLKTLYAFKNLEELIFEQHKGVIDFSVFAPLKGLKYLIVGGDVFSDVDMINIGELKELPYIEYVSIGDFGNIDLSGIEGVKQLKELCIGWGHSVTKLEAVTALPDLRSLELYDINVESLDFLKDLSVDVRIDLGGIDIKEIFDVNILKRFKECEYESLSANGKPI